MNFKEYLKDSIKIFKITKPDGTSMIYTNQIDSKFINSLKRKYPGLKIINKSSKISSSVWENPKEYGWKIQSLEDNEILDEEGEATTSGDIATVPTRIGKVQRRKIDNYGL